MSRTDHATRSRRRGCGKEYWKSRLHTHGETLGKETKKRTHKYERRNAGRGVRRYSQKTENSETEFAALEPEE